jgi:hypothetical protein
VTTEWGRRKGDHSSITPGEQKPEEHLSVRVHTPVPWFVSLSDPLQVLANDARHTIICLVSGAPSNKEAIGDAAYIAHSANAYPRLVEALKEAIATTTPDSAFLESRVALLRELGEL